MGRTKNAHALSGVSHGLWRIESERDISSLAGDDFCPVCRCAGFDKVAIGAVEEFKSKLPPQWDAKNAVVRTHA